MTGETRRGRAAAWVVQVARGRRSRATAVIAALCIAGSATAGFLSPVPQPASPPPTLAAPVAVVPAAPPPQLIADDVNPERFDQHARIPTNFDRRGQLHADRVPASAAPDVVGAFRFVCQAGQISADDPITFPGQKGRSHLHQFFGNTLTDANSDYESLRRSGDSTCMGPLNRSAYWLPAMMNGQGQVVRPDFVAIYYKRLPDSDPNCRKQGRGCIALPRGLRFVFGHDMLNRHGAPTGDAYWNCQGKGADPGKYPSLAVARQHCSVGSQIGAVIIAPDCWDGINLDSPDHRSHVAYAGYGTTGVYRCPASHPWVIPQFTLGAWYTSDASLPKWHLSSDRMPGMAPMEAGSSLHSDWWGAWDDDTMATWMTHCINRKLNCSDGNLGDGTALNRPPGYGIRATPRLVPAP